MMKYLEEILKYLRLFNYTIKW